MNARPLGAVPEETRADAPAPPPPALPPIQDAPESYPAHDDMALSSGFIPWAWIGAWLGVWALFLALAAWWIADGGAPSARAMWMWLLIWAVGGLSVSYQLVRASANSMERDASLLSLRTARRDIALLEAQLRSATASVLKATQSLGETTELLLAQSQLSAQNTPVQNISAQDTPAQGALLQSGPNGAFPDTAPGDRLGAPRAIAASLHETTHTSLPKHLPQTGGSLPNAPPPSRSEIPVPLAPPVHELATNKTAAKEPVTDASAGLPPLGLRPAPPPDDAVSGPVADATGPSVEPTETELPDIPTLPVIADTLDAPGSVAAPGARAHWSWSEMLAAVDSDDDDGAERVLALLEEQGLRPESLVDDGTLMDALGMWTRQDAAQAGTGLPAMGQLLSIRLDEPARTLRRHLDGASEAFGVVSMFSQMRGTRLERMDPDARPQAVANPEGRAWLFIQAVMAL